MVLTEREWFSSSQVGIIHDGMRRKKMCWMVPCVYIYIRGQRTIVANGKILIPEIGRSPYTAIGAISNMYAVGFLEELSGGFRVCFTAFQQAYFFDTSTPDYAVMTMSEDEG